MFPEFETCRLVRNPTELSSRTRRRRSKALSARVVIASSPGWPRQNSYLSDGCQGWKNEIARAVPNDSPAENKVKVTSNEQLMTVQESDREQFITSVPGD